ncbi:putative endodeoxyribonuclease PWA37_000697 [Arxiozyma heterogenica]|uniref:Uncharacterized protein n=1 Tax=Arxiozyma heterogenica TaxID=278026 RepID=A0AAN7WQQ7_9SACH|nr:hypothetical protein RI543_000584 [Kazachstania heterogenica]
MLVDAHCHYYCSSFNDCCRQNNELERDNNVGSVLSLYNSTKLDDISNIDKVGKGKVEVEEEKEEEQDSERQRLYIKKGLGIHPWYAHLYTLVPNISKTEHYGKVLQWKGRSTGQRKEGQTTTIEEEELRRMINALPEPILLNDNLDLFLNNIDFIGEIGLDKTFRIPWGDNSSENMGSCGKRGTVSLSNFTTKLEHQLSILQWWLKYANKHSLSVQLHSVKFYDQLLEVCKDQLLLNPKCKILLHGFQGSVDTLKRWSRIFKSDRIYVSFNPQLNLRNNDHMVLLLYLEVLDIEHVFVETDSYEFNETTYRTIANVTKILQEQSPNKEINFKSNVLNFLNIA